MIRKTAYEEIFLYHQFKRSDGQGWLNESETISAQEVKCYDDAGTETTSTMISDAAVYSNTMVKWKLKAGTAGTNYTIKIKITSSNGQKFEDWLEAKVL